MEESQALAPDVETQPEPIKPKKSTAEYQREYRRRKKQQAQIATHDDEPATRVESVRPPPKAKAPPTRDKPREQAEDVVQTLAAGHVAGAMATGVAEFELNEGEIAELTDVWARVFERYPLPEPVASRLVFGRPIMATVKVEQRKLRLLTEAKRETPSTHNQRPLNFRRPSRVRPESQPQPSQPTGPSVSVGPNGQQMEAAIDPVTGLTVYRPVGSS